MKEFSFCQFEKSMYFAYFKRVLGKCTNETLANNPYKPCISQHQNNHNTKPNSGTHVFAKLCDSAICALQYLTSGVDVPDYVNYC